MTIRKAKKKGAAKGRGREKTKKGSRPSAYSAMLPPRESQRITLQAAIDLTQRYRKAAPASEHGGFFWTEGIQAILSQPGCVGLRYYHGLDAEARYQIVLVGVDAHGNDITKGVALPAKSSRSAKGATTTAMMFSDGDAVLLDRHWPCPPYCPPDGSLLL